MSVSDFLRYVDIAVSARDWHIHMIDGYLWFSDW